MTEQNVLCHIITCNELYDGCIADDANFTGSKITGSKIIPSSPPFQAGQGSLPGQGSALLQAFHQKN